MGASPPRVQGRRPGTQSSFEGPLAPRAPPAQSSRCCSSQVDVGMAL